MVIDMFVDGVIIASFHFTLAWVRHFWLEMTRVAVCGSSSRHYDHAIERQGGRQATRATQHYGDEDKDKDMGVHWRMEGNEDGHIHIGLILVTTDFMSSRNGAAPS